MKIVNGYVCACSDEVRLAKRGIDPANPHNDPAKQRELDAKRGALAPEALQASRPGDLDPSRQDAVVFGGRLADEGRAGGAAPTWNASGAASGRLVDLFA